MRDVCGRHVQSVTSGSSKYYTYRATRSRAEDCVGTNIACEPQFCTPQSLRDEFVSSVQCIMNSGIPVLHWCEDPELKKGQGQGNVRKSSAMSRSAATRRPFGK